MSRDFLQEYINKYRAFSNNPVGQVDRDGLADAGPDKKDSKHPTISLLNCPVEIDRSQQDFLFITKITDLAPDSFYVQVVQGTSSFVLKANPNEIIRDKFTFLDPIPTSPKTDIHNEAEGGNLPQLYKDFNFPVGKYDYTTEAIDFQNSPNYGVEFCWYRESRKISLYKTKAHDPFDAKASSFIRSLTVGNKTYRHSREADQATVNATADGAALYEYSYDYWFYTDQKGKKWEGISFSGLKNAAPFYGDIDPLALAMALSFIMGGGL